MKITFKTLEQAQAYKEKHGYNNMIIEYSESFNRFNLIFDLKGCLETSQPHSPQH